VRAVAIILWREMRSYFVSPVAYTLLVAFLALSGWYFYNLLTHFLLIASSAAEQAEMLQQLPPVVNVNMGVLRPWFLIAGQILLVLTPILTMRLLAEERSSGRLDLLLSAPVTDLQLVLGKYLAGVALCALFLVPTFVYPVLLFAYGNPEPGQIVAGYVGLLLLSMALVALGLAVSSLTGSAVVAAAGSFGLSVFLWVIGIAAGGDGTRWGALLSYLSLLWHYSDFADGVLESRHVVYCLTVAGFLLFVTLRAIASQRWRGARSRGVAYGGQAFLSGALLLAVLFFINFLAARHNRQIDLTEAGLFTLAPETQRVLRALPRPVRVLAFFPAGRREQAADLLRRYADISPRFRYELIDPDQEPEQAQQYGVTAYGTAVVEVEPAMAGDKAAAPIRVEADPAGQRALSLSEEKLTNALVRVVRGGAKSIYFLQGHGEADTGSTEMNGYSRLRTALEGQAFTVKPLLLARTPNVPADCTVLVIAGPGTEPLAGEMSAVTHYLEPGGRVLALVDPAPAAGLETLLNDWGLTLGHDLVLDTSGAGRLFGAGPALPLVNDYNPEHPITHDFRRMTLFPLARSVTPKPAPGDAAAAPLAMTGPESFAEPYAGGERHARFDPTHDRRGPITLASAVMRETSAGRQARLVVVGSSNFVSNAFFDKAGNGDFLLGAVNWLAGEEDLIALTPKPRENHTVQLTDSQARGVFYLTVLLLPAAALVAGCIVYSRRR
jgi:ABC-type uncharacterized transport system involved in gliding motility auxiliary subunit/ABC-type transport system involved in multi-copper enzyme maturation permease subunit